MGGQTLSWLLLEGRNFEQSCQCMICQALSRPVRPVMRN